MQFRTVFINPYPTPDWNVFNLFNICVDQVDYGNRPEAGGQLRNICLRILNR